MSEAWEGGESACWLDRVCTECGRVRERGGEVCEHCGAVSGRDRDPAGRARNARPRDGLGRPLPYGATGVERQPEGILRTPEATLAEAQRLIEQGRPFHAHEVLEDAWKSSAEGERALWRGLAQFAVGLTHAARGNSAGAAALLRRAAEGIEPYGEGPEPYGIQVERLAVWAREQAAAAEAGAAVPAPPPLRGTGSPRP